MQLKNEMSSSEVSQSDEASLRPIYWIVKDQQVSNPLATDDDRINNDRLDDYDNSTRLVDGTGSNQPVSFIEACIRAINLGTEVILDEGAVVDIGGDSLRISKKRQTLKIRCLGSRGATILGSGHSVFIVEGKHTKLILDNITVLHDSRVDEDGGYNKRDIGAALYVRNSGVAVLSRCAMVSRLGFGLWAVQKASISLSGCFIRSFLRSGCVLFCDANVTVQTSVIFGCALHGICMRARASLSISDSLISRCGKRGIYAYHNVRLEMTRCVICGIGTEIEPQCHSDLVNANEELERRSKGTLNEINSDAVRDVAKPSDCNRSIIIDRSNSGGKFEVFRIEDIDIYRLDSYSVNYSHFGYRGPINSRRLAASRSAAIDVNGRDEQAEDSDDDSGDDNGNKGGTRSTSDNGGKFNSNNSRSDRDAKEGGVGKKGAVIEPSMSADDSHSLYLSMVSCEVLFNSVADYSFTGKIRGLLADCLLPQRPENLVIQGKFLNATTLKSSILFRFMSDEHYEQSTQLDPSLLAAVLVNAKSENRKANLASIFIVSSPAAESKPVADTSNDKVHFKSNDLESEVNSGSPNQYFVWEYQCDDSSTTATISSATSCDALDAQSFIHDWRPFDKASSDLIEAKFLVYSALIVDGSIFDSSDDDDEDEGSGEKCISGGIGSHDENSNSCSSKNSNSNSNNNSDVYRFVLGSLNHYEIDLRYLTQTNCKTHYSRLIRRRIVSSSTNESNIDHKL